MTSRHYDLRKGHSLLFVYEMHIVSAVPVSSEFPRLVLELSKPSNEHVLEYM